MGEAAILPNQMDQIFDLRWRVLREPLGLGKGTECDQYDNPELYPDTVHSAISHKDLVVATGRIHQLDKDPSKLRVRYMAVDPAHRGRGLGSTILQCMEATAHERFPDGRSIILDARYQAVNLYRRAGYTAVTGRVYYSSLSGLPHIKMHKKIGSGT